MLLVGDILLVIWLQLLPVDLPEWDVVFLV